MKEKKTTQKATQKATRFHFHVVEVITYEKVVTILAKNEEAARILAEAGDYDVLRKWERVKAEVVEVRELEKGEIV